MVYRRLQALMNINAPNRMSDAGAPHDLQMAFAINSCCKIMLTQKWKKHTQFEYRVSPKNPWKKQSSCMRTPPIQQNYISIPIVDNEHQKHVFPKNANDATVDDASLGAWSKDLIGNISTSRDAQKWRQYLSQFQIHLFIFWHARACKINLWACTMSNTQLISIYYINFWMYMRKVHRRTLCQQFCEM